LTRGRYATTTAAVKQNKTIVAIGTNAKNRTDVYKQYFKEARKKKNFRAQKFQMVKRFLLTRAMDDGSPHALSFAPIGGFVSATLAAPPFYLPFVCFCSVHNRLW
jgi:hypothetical protein